MKAPKAHPVAELFPMLADADLADLAESIAEQGLLHPIVLDADGRILDGRNRFAACKLAGIAPSFVTYEGEDPDAYALTVNVARRNLSKGQVAMVAARASRLVHKVDTRTAAATHGVSKSRISQGSVILDYAPDLADAVVAGATALNDAYKVAQERKRDAESAEKRLAWLQERHPNLAEMVAEEELSLAEALAAAKERDEAVASAGRLFMGNLSKGVSAVLAALSGREADATIRFYLGSTAVEPEPPTPADCRAAADALIEAADVLEALAKETK